MQAVLFFLSVFLVLACHGASSKKIVCYYGTWATYRSGLGKFEVKNINTDLCTHVVYTFAGISSQGTIISLDPYLDLAENWGRDNFRQFTNLKQKNPNLKTILAVGGWNEGSRKFSIMASNVTKRQNFIKSVTGMLSKYGFDGLDLDWEYPNRRDTVYGLADVNNFSTLLREMREEFDKYGYLLTAAVSAVEASAAYSYDIPTITRYLDFVNIMTYDMHGSWDAVTGHNAPLHKSAEDGDTDRKNLYTVDVALEYWIGQGCPPEKIVFGVPFYARTFTLTNASNNSVRAPISGPGIAGPYTATNGFIGYNEFCKKLQTESWTRRYDARAKVPYAFRNRDWVSFDDADSIKTKIEFGVRHNITGVMIWSIETDDFNNVCGGGDFPLLRAINAVLDNAGNNTNVNSTVFLSSFSTTPIPTNDSTTDNDTNVDATHFPSSPLPTSESTTDNDSNVNATYFPTSPVPTNESTTDYDLNVNATYFPTSPVPTNESTTDNDSNVNTTYYPSSPLPTSVSTTDNDTNVNTTYYPSSPLPTSVSTTDNDTNVNTTEVPTTFSPTSMSTERNTTVTPIISTTSITSDPTPATSNSSVTTEAYSSICTKEGFEADPTDCSRFYVCFKDNVGDLVHVRFHCPDGLYWDKNLLICNYPSLTECNV